MKYAEGLQILISTASMLLQTATPEQQRAILEDLKSKTIDIYNECKNEKSNRGIVGSRDMRISDEYVNLITFDMIHEQKIKIGNTLISVFYLN